jgi:hypothetical protein
VFATPWPPCTEAYAARMRCISDESVPAFLAGIQPNHWSSVLPTKHANVLWNVTRCAIMRLSQRKRVLHWFLRANRFDSSGFVFIQFADPESEAQRHALTRIRQGECSPYSPISSDLARQSYAVATYMPQYFARF